MASFIQDGYTREDGFIEGSEPDKNGNRLYDSLEFTYRPAARLEVVQLDADIRIALKNQETDRTCAVKAEQIACKFAAEHIKSWNLKLVGVHDVPVTAASCERIHPYLFNSLYAVIRDERTNDVKPVSENSTEAAKQPPSDSEQVKN